MNVEVAKGRYVLAVSGGVDSMVLLDLLARKPGIEVIVAHFNHNIRSNSKKDETLVRAAASKYKVKYEAGSAKLGSQASEEVAREARYKFLRKVRDKYKADAIITAHHQDDLIETAMINVIRGTGRLGLSSIANNPEITRPLLAIPKKNIIKYATEKDIVWNDDSTNINQDYLRNYLRLSVIPRLSPKERKELILKLDKVAKTNIEIDDKIAKLSQTTGKSDIDRNLFASLPSELGNELVAHNLRQAGIADFDSKTINRLSMAIKTSKPNSSHPIKNSSKLVVKSKSAKIVTP